MRTHSQSCRPENDQTGNWNHSFMLRCGIGAWRSVALLFSCVALNAAALVQRFTENIDTNSNAVIGCRETANADN
jgi:hypothetical protein